MSLLNQGIEGSQQFFDIMKMKTGSWFIKNEKNFASSFSLSQEKKPVSPVALHHPKAYRKIVPALHTQALHRLKVLWHWHNAFFVLEKFNGFIHTHFQNFINIFAFILHFQHFFFKSFAITNFTGEMHIGKKLHFHDLFTFSFTGITRPPSTLNEKCFG